MSGEKLSAGQRVVVELGDEKIAGVFVRYAPQQHGVNVKGADDAGDARGAVGWVRRADTGEIEPIEYGLVAGA